MTNLSSEAVNAQRRILYDILEQGRTALQDPLQVAPGTSSPSDDVDASLRSPSIRSREDVEAEDALLENPAHAFLMGPYTMEEGRTLKRSKNLSPRSDGDAELFITPSRLARHGFMAYLVSLECRDRLTEICKYNNEVYKLSDAFQKTCMSWAHAAVLSATANSYRDDTPGSIAANIMPLWIHFSRSQKVMRSQGIAELPPTKETGRCDIVKSVIVSGLTTYRHDVKATIFKALIPLKSGTEADSEANKDVRACAVEHKKNKATDGTFWKTVDTKLALYRAVANNKEGLQILFNADYNTDKKLYGEPDAAIPLTLMKDVEDWLTALQAGVI
ncbi:hypothetical protein B0H17DRAFT_1134137 [Mycena rosella]|uniref:Uncharacterized protein n=1 Tax=Mycena rosella TaxID=1033263 RepID=A0AAD7GHB0_MYCRO|nr:hypothetical protein B0H17DRAFT_1134137 [Mycena rosella]